VRNDLWKPDGMRMADRGVRGRRVFSPAELFGSRFELRPGRE
jgi:hypothetical protein